MKPSQHKGLERLYRRRVPPEEVITLDLARELVELSREIRRQLGLLVNRSGDVEYVIVGDERGLYIPELSDYPLGKKLLRELRLIHTHLKGESLTDDDLTDLALLRLDLIAALQISPVEGQFSIQTAYLAPHTPGKALTEPSARSHSAASSLTLPALSKLSSPLFTKLPTARGW